ncbi:hypothetical protein ACFVH6_08755 [Spirillospora sp. NPDC127200]
MTVSTSRQGTAHTVVEELTRARAPRPDGNDFLVRLREGAVTADDLRRLVHAETLAATAEIRAYAAMAVRHPHPLFPALLDMAHQAKPKIVECARTLGLGDEQIAQAPTRFSTLAYPAFLAWLALHADRAGLGAAVYTDLDGYYADSVLVAEGLRAAGPEVPGDLVDYYSSPMPEGLRDLVLALLQEGLEAGDDDAEALSLGRMMEASLAAFWRSALPE